MIGLADLAGLAIGLAVLRRERTRPTHFLSAREDAMAIDVADCQSCELPVVRLKPLLPTWDDQSVNKHSMAGMESCPTSDGAMSLKRGGRT